MKEIRIILQEWTIVGGKWVNYMDWIVDPKFSDEQQCMHEAKAELECWYENYKMRIVREEREVILGSQL